MYMSKKISVLFCLLVTFVASVFAQVSVDPNDVFYKDAKNWETKGIIGWLPQIRPYSIDTVKAILAEVKENGDEEDVKLADYYSQKYFSKNWNAGITVGADLKKANDDGLKKMLYAEPEIFGDISLLKIVGFGYQAGILAQNNSVKEKEILPMFENSRNNTYDDPANVWKIEANIDVAANLTVGKSDLYGMFGLNKVAYGPFVNDSVLLNGTQFHSGNFSFIYEGEKLGYTQIFSTLSRSEKNGDAGVLDFVPEKYMGFHSVRFTPIKQLAISYFETSTITNRFDPAYLLPVPYMIIQGMFGASDNTISGLTFDIRPIDRLGVSISGLVDDVNLNELMTGHFDTRFKFALMAGVNYTPEVSFIDNLSLDYTIVPPYTYSHNDPSLKINVYDKNGDIDTSLLTKAKDMASSYNKDNFTTRLTSLGTKIPPNSDRIHFGASFRPVERLRLDFNTTFVRHANIAESYSAEEARNLLTVNNALAGEAKNGDKPLYYSTDGSIWTSSLDMKAGDYNWFMRQDHKMYILQYALNAEYELERQKWGTLVFNAGYMFEYIHNKGVDTNIYSAINNTSDSVTLQQVEDAKKNWVANLHNVFNNYFSVSVKYFY